MNKKLICAGLILVIIITLYKLYKRTTESFAPTVSSTFLPDGVYSITHSSGVPLVSSAIDTVMCKDFKIDPAATPQSVNWQLHRVAQSVYILYKPGKKECLYTNPANEVRSYSFPGCNTQNLCGLEKPDTQGELDKESLRTYFMVLKHGSGKHLLKSMKNDGYLCMKHGQVSFENSPSKDCLFDIRSA